MVTAAAVATFFGGVGTAVTVGYVVATIAINLAIAAILGKILAPDVPKDGRDTKALQTVVRDNILPRRIGYGEFVTGGPYVALETFGSDNEFFTFIVALTGHPIEDVLGVFIEDDYVDISGNTTGVSNSDPNDLSSNWYIDTGKFGSTQTNADTYQLVRIIKNLGWGYADLQYVTDGSNSNTKVFNDRRRGDKIEEMFGGNYWNQPATIVRDSGTGLYTSTGKKLTNCAHVAMQIRYEPDVWAGYPQIKFHCKGKPLYNPAKDGTRVAEGADSGGTHRLDDPDTWEWSEDWTLCVLDYLINDDYGMGAKTSGQLTEIDWAEAIQSYRDSSELIPSGITGGQSKPRYTVNGIFETTSTPISTMEALLTSGAGELVYSQGTYKIRPGIYREPSSELDIINEDMMVGPLGIQTHTPRANLFNKAAGIYVAAGYNRANPPSNSNKPDFEPNDFPIVDPLDSSGLNPYEVEDGEEIIREFDYPFTIEGFEAQRLARIQLERVRRGFAVTFNATLEVLKYSVGDTVYLEILSNSKYQNEAFFNRLGLDDDLQDRPNSPFTPYYKQFKITDMQYNEDFTVAVTMIEESPDIYDWNEGDALPQDEAPESDLQITDPTGTIIAPNWNVLSPNLAVDEVTDEGGTLTVLKWNAPERSSPIDYTELDKAFVSSYYLEYGIVDNPSAPDPADRVSDWIVGGSFFVTDPTLNVQGPIALKNIYQAVGDEFDFRVKAVLYSGRSSPFAYFSADTGADFDPTVPLNLEQYSILPIAGFTISNSIGTVTLQVRSTSGLGNNLVTSGDVKLYEAESPYNEITAANGYVSGSDGYTGIFDAGDINGNKVIILSDGPAPGGTILDSVNLQDVTDGAPGGAGQAVRTVNMYNLNDSTVADTSGGTFANPISGTNASDGWSLNVPAITADGDTVYVTTRTFTDDAQSPQDPTWATPTIYSQRVDGVAGGNGVQVRTVNMFNLNDSTVADPTGGTFASPISATNSSDGWQINVPGLAADGDEVYVSVRTFTADAGSPQDPSWSTPTVYAARNDGIPGEPGATGPTGKAVRTVNMYNLNDNTVADTTGGTFDVPINGTNASDGWTLSVPALTADGDIVYVTTRTFANDAGSPQDPSWSAPTIYSQRVDGVDGGPGTAGQSVRTVNMYNLNDPTVAAPTGGDFFTPIDSANAADGWTLSVPDITADGDIVYVSTRTFTDDAASPQDPSWSSPTVYSQRTDGVGNLLPDPTFDLSTALGASGEYWDTKAVGTGSSATLSTTGGVQGTQAVNLITGFNSLDSIQIWNKQRFKANSPPLEFYIRYKTTGTADYDGISVLAEGYDAATGGTEVGSVQFPANALTASIPGTDGQWQLLRINLDTSKITEATHWRVTFQVFENNSTITLDSIFVYPGIVEQVDATNYLLDPLFELTGDLYAIEEESPFRTRDTGTYWEAYAENEGGISGEPGTSIPWFAAVEKFDTGGANNGPYIRFRCASIDQGITYNHFAEITNVIPFRASENTFVVRIKYMRDDANDVPSGFDTNDPSSGNHQDEFQVAFRGYADATGSGPPVASTIKNFVVPDTAGVWTDLTVVVDVPGGATAEYWKMTIGSNGIINDINNDKCQYVVNLDSVFVYNSASTFATQTYQKLESSVRKTKTVEGLVPQADTTDDAGKVLGAAGGWTKSITDGVDDTQPLGFNTIPGYAINANDTFDSAHQGMMWHKTSGGGVTFTCDSETTIDAGATWMVHNDDLEDLTITATSPCVVYWIEAGSAPAAGDVTVKQGGIVSVYKRADDEYWVWGAKDSSGGGGVTNLGALTDVDLTGAADNDLLYRSGSNWVDTAGNLTWDGTNFSATQVRITGTGDAGLASTTHGFQVGATNSANVVIDNNEIGARSNGTTTTFYINEWGGEVRFGGTGTSNVVINGSLTLNQGSPNINVGSGYLDVKNNTAGVGGVRILNSSDAIQGYLYADGSQTFGLLHSGGGWAVQIAPGANTVTFPGTINTNGNITGDNATNITGINAITTVGNVTVGGELIADSGGSQTDPKIRFDNDTDTGFYSNAVGQLSVSAGGDRQMLFTSTNVSVDNAMTVGGIGVFPSQHGLTVASAFNEYNRFGASFDMNTLREPGQYGAGSATTNGPAGLSFDPLLVMASASDVTSQLVVPRTASRALAYRGETSDVFTAWHYAAWTTTAADAQLSLYAKLASPSFSGTVTAPIVNASSYLSASQLRTNNGTEVVINAGESASYATGQTAERVYLNAESGVELSSSPSNWTSPTPGWANRNTTILNDSSGNSSFANNITVGGNVNATSGVVDSQYYTAVALGPNLAPSTDDLLVGGYGILGNRGSPVYVSNAGGAVVLNHGAVHGSNTKLTTTSTGVTVTGLITASDLVLSTDDPQFDLNDTNAGTDLKRWRQYTSAGTWYLTAVNDAQSGQTTAMSFSRSGQSPTQLTVLAQLGVGTSSNYFTRQADQSMRYTANTNGYIEFGPKNTSYCHIYSDRTGGFYMNRRLFTTGSHSIQEAASASSDLAGFGQFWIRNDAPNTAWFTNDVGTDYPLGYNSMPIIDANASQNFLRTQVGHMLHKSSGGAVTFTCAQDTSTWNGATWLVHNDDTENLTIAAGTSVTVYWIEGGSAPAAGSVTVAQGGIVTVFKRSNTEFWVWGAKDGGTSGISSVVQDTTPQLGGTLDSNAFDIWMKDNDQIQLGTPTNGDARLYSNGVDIYLDLNNGVDFRLRGGAAGTDPMITCIDDGGVFLYHNGREAFRTQTYNTNSVTSSVKIEDHAGVDHDAGFNDLKNIVILGSTSSSYTLSNLDAGMILTKTGTSANTSIVLPSSTTEFPEHSVCTFVYTSVSAVATVTLNASTNSRNLYWLTGSAVTGGASTNRTLAKGCVVTIYRQDANNYFIWGSGIS